MFNDFLEELNLCSRCGFCQNVCPTYKAKRIEGSVARGRIRLAKIVEEGNYKWSRNSKINEYINDCLLCGACVSVCPGAVPTPELMIRARQNINQNSGFTAIHKLVYKGVLCDQKKLKFGRKLLRFYQATGMSFLLRSTKVLGAVPKLKELEERLPDVPKQSFFEMLPKIQVKLQNPIYKLGYFCGCATNSFYGNVAVSAAKVLQKLNYEVSFPRVECCGEPQKSIGDLDGARNLARRNIDIFLENNFDYILTDCATCGSALKNYGKLLENDDLYKEKSKKFSSMVYDLNEFLIEQSKISTKLNPLDNHKQIKVTYHDPCHQVRGQNIASAPREVLKSIPGVKLIEMEEADTCCGGAGAYGFIHGDLSQKILKSKMNHAKATGANYLATSCPACMMQLEYGIRHEKLDIKLVHPIELLELAL
ncbi:(Fe-S)-binding protein [Desulfitobacterium sp. AusDCA]|uniref:(Fe-S)-binding protein n=1 Tax=Desulfitobacterium sp. AusDCA TaxID=3240383 RepID=UPI003DA6EE7A